MLVGRDLGVFSCLVLVVIFVSLVVGWVVCRKWRLAVARREEIKRLLVLASQEAARAELEAISGYGFSAGAEGVEAPAASIPPIPSSPTRQFQYHCALCFSPTTTRCARCKAVRYCSGKCQIIHWRQGHKEECHPFTSNDQSNDIGGSYNLKASKQDEYESSCDSLDAEERPSANPVEASSEQPASFSFSSELPHGRDEILAENYADEKETGTIPAAQLVNEEYCALAECKEAGNTTGSLNDFDNCDRPQSTSINPDKFETKSANMDKISPSSDHPILVDSIERLISSHKLDQIKKNCIDGDSHCGSSTSSGWSVESSNESSFSEPSTPTSGFWEGTLDSSRSRGCALDDSVQYISSESVDGNISDFQTPASLSLYLERISVSSAEIQGSTAKTVTSDNDCPTTLGVSQPIGRVTSFKEMNKNRQKYMRSPSLSSELSSHNDLGICVDPHVTKSSEVRYFSSGAFDAHPVSSGGGNSNKVAQVSNSSSSSDTSINGTNGTGDTLHMLKPRAEGNFSLGASVSSFAYSNGRHFESNVKLKNDSPQEVSALSSHSAGHLQNTRNGLKTSMWKVVDQLKASKLSRHHSMVLGSEAAGRYNNKGLFQYDLFVKLYNWNKIELRPCGLINCGNSCYANAVLQCLAFTPPLTAYLLQGIHSKACEKKEWCFTCEFGTLVLKAKDCSSALSPINILSQIQNIGSHLSNGREEDAHEFLRHAIDKMQSICLKEAGVNASGSLEEETTLIGLTFGGYLRSKIQCMKCESKSERHEKMMDLTVEIEGDIRTLEEALRQFTGTEILDGENKYRCDRCKSYERAKKKLTILEAPNILTIALKRFQSGKFGKLNKSIYFPEILDLAPYMSGTSDKSPIYQLYGVVVHLDVENAAFSGHYVCYVKNVQNKWFKIDDSVVKPVELGKVLRKGAYMLLYARCSPRAPRIIRNSKTSRDPRKLKISTVKSRSHSSGAWDFPAFDPLNNQSNLESYNMVASHRTRENMEEDSSSDKSSFFSESGSSSTESSRDSTSTDDYFDQIFGDLGRHRNNPWRSSSDSDTSSSLLPLYARHSPLADLDRYASRYGETSGSNIDIAGAVLDNYGVRARVPGRSNKDKSLEGKGGDPFLYSNPVRHCRKLGNSSSSGGTDSDRSGGFNPFDFFKSGTSFRWPTRGRTD